MTTAYYNYLALSWTPDSKSDRQFKRITAVIVTIMMSFGLALSIINVPKEERQVRTSVPERVANFIMEREKPKPKPQKPKPKPQPAKPPVIKRMQEKPSELKKPITQAQKKAREKAADSGLLALSSELADLMDTSDVSREVGGNVKASAGSAKVATQNTALLSDNVAKGSGGVSADKYTTTVVAKSNLTQREITQVKQSLLASGAKGSSGGKGSGSGDFRAEEDLTIIFDQNKSVLYSLYERERRKSPGLKGKIVLEITISPSGKVTAVKVVSSELNSPSLEGRLVSRIKMFAFGERPVKSITVTYPIEFLPS